MRSTPRTRRLNENVREALGSILSDEVGDPRLVLVTVTAVEVSPDMRYADVYVVAHGDEQRYEAMLQGLASARSRLRSALAARVAMKYVPELRFHLDTSVDEGMRIERALLDVPPGLRYGDESKADE